MQFDLTKPGVLIRGMDGSLFFIPDERLNAFRVPAEQASQIDKLGLRGPTRAVPAGLLGSIAGSIGTKGTIGGMLPGMIPGMLGGMIPGMLGGMIPGMLGGMIPGMLGGMIPGMLGGMGPGMLPGMIPGGL